MNNEQMLIYTRCAVVLSLVAGSTYQGDQKGEREGGRVEGKGFVGPEC